jgi:hypothetical protein
LVTLTKVDDLLLTFPVRSRDGRPCLVLDPFALAAKLLELVWAPIAGCVDPMAAERRAKAFTAGTIKAALGGGYGERRYLIRFSCLNLGLLILPQARSSSSSTPWSRRPLQGCTGRRHAELSTLLSAFDQSMPAQ